MSTRSGSAAGSSSSNTFPLNVNLENDLCTALAEGTPYYMASNHRLFRYAWRIANSEDNQVRRMVTFKNSKGKEMSKDRRILFQVPAKEVVLLVSHDGDTKSVQ